METVESRGPEVFVSQSEKSTAEAEHHFPATDFVLVDGATLHVWVEGMHFVEDTDGRVEDGQYFLVRGPGMGVMISEIIDVDVAEQTATVRHLFRWTNGELKELESSETWAVEEITGEFERTMGDASQSWFLTMRE